MEHQSTSPERKEAFHEGLHYLEVLGLEQYAQVTSPKYGIPIQDFLDVCGDHARPFLTGLDSLDREDPDFIEGRNTLRQYVMANFIPENTEE